MNRGLLAQRLLAVFAAGWLLLGYPLLGLALGEGSLVGLPRLPLLLFLGWAVLIALLAVLMEGSGSRSADEDGAGG